MHNYKYTKILLDDIITISKYIYICITFFHVVIMMDLPKCPMVNQQFGRELLHEERKAMVECNRSS